MLAIGLRLRGDRDLFVVLFSCRLHFNVFPFPPSNPKLIGNVLMNRNSAAPWYIIFFLFLQRELPIDAPIHPALLGDARLTEKKSAKK
jgi:hypothetical protein